jgi:hypothetical protein
MVYSQDISSSLKPISLSGCLIIQTNQRPSTEFYLRELLKDGRKILLWFVLLHYFTHSSKNRCISKNSNFFKVDIIQTVFFTAKWNTGEQAAPSVATHSVPSSLVIRKHSVFQAFSKMLHT